MCHPPPACSHWLPFRLKFVIILPDASLCLSRLTGGRRKHGRGNIRFLADDNANNDTAINTDNDKYSDDVQVARKADGGENICVC